MRTPEDCIKRVRQAVERHLRFVSSAREEVIGELTTIVTDAVEEVCIDVLNALDVVEDDK